MNFRCVKLQLLFIGATCLGSLVADAPGQDNFPATNEKLQERLANENVSDLVDDIRRVGDPVRGALSFFQPELNCARCHDEEQSGRRLGPDLEQRRVVTIEHLIESILHPSRQIKEGYETAVVQTLDGRLLTGVLVGETPEELIIDQIEQPTEPLRLDKDQIEDWQKTTKSSMPEYLADQLADRQQFLDLVSYLFEISEGGPERAEQLRPAESLFAEAPLPEYESRVDHRTLIESWNEESFERGEETYRLRCASCHGTIEKEGSLPRSMRFADGRFKNGKDPLSLYKTLTHGYGMMNPQRWMVPQQKYDVIHYVREHFLRDENPDEYFQVGVDYLDSLPAGDTTGPEPVVRTPWTDMNYGPSLNNTIEISHDGSNIAQKGIAVRLDPGPGGVESGTCWMLYDHDTMRVAGAWSGRFIDYNGIHLNGVHGRHPRVAGPVHFANPVGPGWGRPRDHSFVDERLIGRDGKRYGPLPRDWLDYKGMYRYGNRTILSYRVGRSEILESPAMRFVDGKPVYVRQFNIEPRDTDLVLQVARTDSRLTYRSNNDQTIAFVGENKAGSTRQSTARILRFDGAGFAQSDSDHSIDVSDNDFSIYAEIKTEQDGTIFSSTNSQAEWVPDGKTFFVRDGRLHYDIGWVGVVDSDIEVDDGNWHQVVMTWQAGTGKVGFFVDGEPAGAGRLKSKGELTNSVVRIGFTNDDFPRPSRFRGEMRNIRLYSRILSREDLEENSLSDAGLTAHWKSSSGDRIADASGSNNGLSWVSVESNEPRVKRSLLISTDLERDRFEWNFTENGDVRLRLLSIDEPQSFSVQFFASDEDFDPKRIHNELSVNKAGAMDLSRLIAGGPRTWTTLQSEIVRGSQPGPFQVDVLKRPVDRASDRLRLTGLDFLRGGRDAVICCWDGTVWRLSGIDENVTGSDSQITWQRIATGLFQPLGVKVVDEKIYIACRDQIVCLHDLNGDGEADWYENFNSDHQVTEHFHEFAMGLQTDKQGNFYYAKSARHALPAVVPHHGTLLRVTPDGKETEIVANGFRAANGVCLNDDGSFIVTDQEGHWNPKNRINWVTAGGFYGNMFGYHDVHDSSDGAMEPPLCWITNSFDRSPAELMWVTSDRWSPLKGSLLNFSYGNGRIFIVPHEKVGEKIQGGMCALPLKRFPTGIMRGRFSPLDGQLYCCGMFAWSGDQTQPGGLYRVRFTGQPVYLPIGIRAGTGRLDIEFSGKLDAAAASDVNNFRVTTWDLKRTENYGSDHYNTQRLAVQNAVLNGDGTIVSLLIPELMPTWCMEIKYAILNEDGNNLRGTINNTIHQLAE